jgi:hypothetical protein
MQYEQKEFIKNWKDGVEDGIVGKNDISDYIRNYLFDKYDNKCQICE